MCAEILILSTGGSIDKYYDTSQSDFTVGEPQAGDLLREAGVSMDFDLQSILRKDSLQIDAEDRRLIADCVSNTPHARVLITHGTDTMVDTGLALADIPGKTIVLTGAMQPAAFKRSDAAFNLGAAFLAVQALPPGVYIVMNGRVFDPQHAQKNLIANRFEIKE